MLGVVKPIDNTRSYEKSCLAQILSAQLHHLRNLPLSTRLGTPFQDAPELALALGSAKVAVSKSLVFNNMPIAAGEVISADDELGFVVRDCVEMDSARFGLRVQLLEGHERLTAHSARWKVGAGLTILHLAPGVRLLHASFWKLVGDSATVIR